MAIPIILGASEKLKRTGGTFFADCPQCSRDNVKMFEAVKHTNVSAFFAISLWDGEDPVVQCGECLAVFGEEDAKSLRSPAPPTRISARPPPPKRPAIDEAAIDAELLALKKRLGR